MKWHFDEILKNNKKTENTECVICGNKSKQVSKEYKEIKQKHTKTYIDGKPVKDYQIIYSYQTCPYCGYTNTEINSLPKYDSKTEICQKMDDNYQTIFHSKEPFFIKQQKLFNIINTNIFHINQFCFWYYEEIGDTERAKLFLKEQIAMCKKEILIYQIREEFSYKIYEIYTLIIDAHRRLGNFDEALKFVNECRAIEFNNYSENYEIYREIRKIQILEIACLHKNKERMKYLPIKEKL